MQRGNYGSTLGATMGKGREPQIILKTDQAPRPQTWREGKFVVKSSSLDGNGLPPGRQARRHGQERPLGDDPPARWAGAGTGAGRTLLTDGVVARHRDGATPK
jgi:hypothetical protein